MMPDPQNKNPRTFQCRDYLWDAFEAIAQEMDCTTDSLVNEALRVYLQSKGRGGPMADIPEPLEPRAGAGFRAPGMGQPGMGQPGMGQPGMGMPGMPRPGMPGQPPPMGPGARPGMPGAPPPMPGMPGMQQQPPRPGMPPMGQGAQPGMPGRLPPLGGQQGGLPPMNPNMPRPPSGPGMPGGMQGGMPGGMQGGMPGANPMMGGPRPPQMPGAPPPMGQAPGMGNPMMNAPRPMAPPQQMPGAPRPQPGRQGGTLVAIYEGQQYPVTKEEFVIGRGQKTSDLTIRDSNVSRRHACVVLYNGQYWIVDQQSTNGVEYNGTKVDKKVVEHGDVFRICDHEIQFVYR